MLKKYSQYYANNMGMSVKCTTVWVFSLWSIIAFITWWIKSFDIGSNHLKVLFQLFDALSALQSIPQFITHYCHSASIENEWKMPAHLQWPCTVRLYSCCRKIWFMIILFLFAVPLTFFQRLGECFFNCFLLTFWEILRLYFLIWRCVDNT